MTKSIDWRKAAVLLATGAVLIAGGCERDAGSQEEVPVARPVKTLVVAGAGAGERSFPGRVEASSQVDLSFRVGGPLVELSVREGDLVQKGQLIARIDPKDFEIQLNSARAEHERAEADYSRYTALYEKDAVSKAQLDQALAARDVARAALDDAEVNLDYTNLRAPFTARIGERFVENYQDVRAKQPIVSLVDLDTVDIVVDLPEGLLVRAKRDVAGRVVARFSAAADKEFALALKEIAAQADPRTQTYRVTLMMPQPEEVNILPGMTATVVRYGPEGGDPEDAILVPAIAVFAGPEGKSLVWVVDPDASTVHERQVTTGELAGTDQIRILAGLEPGEMVAVSAVSQLREGMAIRPVEEVIGR
jgi:RND family efflux transporter MFP subunit